MLQMYRVDALSNGRPTDGERFKDLRKRCTGTYNARKNVLEVMWQIASEIADLERTGDDEAAPLPLEVCLQR